MLQTSSAILFCFGIFRTHMQDLKDVTNNVHYENYRYKKLAHVSAADGKADTGDR